MAESKIFKFNNEEYTILLTGQVSLDYLKEWFTELDTTKTYKIVLLRKNVEHNDDIDHTDGEFIPKSIFASLIYDDKAQSITPELEMDDILSLISEMYNIENVDSGNIKLRNCNNGNPIQNGSLSCYLLPILCIFDAQSKEGNYFINVYRVNNNKNDTIDVLDPETGDISSEDCSEFVFVLQYLFKPNDPENNHCIKAKQLTDNGFGFCLSKCVNLDDLFVLTDEKAIVDVMELAL